MLLLQVGHAVAQAYSILLTRLCPYLFNTNSRGGNINVKKHGDESLQLLAYAERVAGER